MGQETAPTASGHAPPPAHVPEAGPDFSLGNMTAIFPRALAHEAILAGKTMSPHEGCACAYLIETGNLALLRVTTTTSPFPPADG